jgi:hypothetical protein
VRYSLHLGKEPPGECVLIADTTCWFAPGFQSWGLLTEWHEKGGPPLMPGKEPGTRRSPEKSDYDHRREFELTGRPTGSPEGCVTLRAHVSYLDAKFLYEVVFVGEDERESLVIPICHPGTPEWYRAMDGADPSGGSTPIEDQNDFLGSGMYYISMRNHWGLVEIEFPVVWLPVTVKKVEVRYRNLPGASLAAISENPRLAYMKLLDLR